MKILIMGLPGSGKTYLAQRLAPALDAVHFNSADVRRTLSSHLGYSREHQAQHALIMGLMSGLVSGSRHIAVADVCCLTAEARDAFAPDVLIWMNTTKFCRHADANDMFEPPTDVNMTITDLNYRVQDIVTLIMAD